MNEPAAHVARTLLVVDDDHVFRSRLARAFAERGYDVREARDVDEARHLAQEETPEFAVVDLRMPGGSGLEVVCRRNRPCRKRISASAARTRMVGMQRAPAGRQTC